MSAVSGHLLYCLQSLVRLMVRCVLWSEKYGRFLLKKFGYFCKQSSAFKKWSVNVYIKHLLNARSQN
ncbi:unnamed protein product, partial [Staurois parvus]